MRAELKAMADALVSVVRPMKSELKDLRERIEALEAHPLKYLGTYERGQMYAKNAVVTHGGSMWIALRPTQQIPGPGDGWQLCVKHGRDAR